jgi:hypothetical protein
MPNNIQDEAAMLMRNQPRTRATDPWLFSVEIGLGSMVFSQDISRCKALGNIGNLSLVQYLVYQPLLVDIR